MHTLIDSLPVHGPRMVQVRGGRQWQILDGQIVIWISVTPLTVISLPRAAPIFPAILDTGFNSTLALSEDQLRDWAGVDGGELRAFPEHQTALPTLKGQRVAPREAAVWLHPNMPGQRDALADRPPFWVYARPGILVLPAEHRPRLPLIGMKLLEQNALQVVLDPVPSTPVAKDFQIIVSVRSVVTPVTG